VTSYAYDAVNRQTAMTEAVGTSVQRTTQQSYDAVGNVTTSTDALNNVSTSVYDKLNRETVSIDPLGHRVTTTYDAVGDTSTRTDPLGKVVTYSYDVRHRQVATTDPLGHTTTNVLDAVGNVAATIDPLGHVSKNILDAVGRHIGNVDALGRVTTMTLNIDDALWVLVDPDGNTTQYTRDGMQREVQSIVPTGAVTTTAYDAVGNVTKVTDRNGRVDSYSYDAANRLTGEVWKNNAGTTVNTVTYSYDTNDNRTVAADGSGTLTTTYDQLNRATGATDVFGLRLTYTYNALDQAYQRNDSLGGLLTSVYDAAGRLTSKQFVGTGPTGTVVRVDFGYNNRDDVTSKTWYSNIAATTVVATSTYGIDDAGRVTSIVDKNSSATTLSYYNYGYDSADRVTTQTYWSQVGTVTYSATKGYSYDATNQLLGDGTTNYSFDANGNRTMTGYSTGADNRMSSDGTYTYTYDSAGNTIQKSKGSGLETWYFGWDNRNRLSSVRKTSDGTTNTLTVTYTYDVDDRLVQQAKWVSGGSTVTTRYAYDGENVWADLDGSNNLLVRYVYGDGMDQVLTRTVASGPNAGVAVYFTDNLGSVRDLANWSGVVQDHLDYSGFGVIVTEAGAAYGDRIKFTARWYDADTGLQNNRARWYQVSTGRWMSEDPSGFGAGDVNLTRYVGNNVTNATDGAGLYQNPVYTGPFNKNLGVTGQYIVPLRDYYGAFYWPTIWTIKGKADEDSGGWILQHVTITLTLRGVRELSQVRIGGLSLPEAMGSYGRRIGTETNPATFVMEYWEAWPVRPTKSNPSTDYEQQFTPEQKALIGKATRLKLPTDKVNDAFWWGAVSGADRGSVSFVGTVYYVDGVDGVRLKGAKAVGRNWAPCPGFQTNETESGHRPSGILPTLNVGGGRTANRDRIREFFECVGPERISPPYSHAITITWDSTTAQGRSIPEADPVMGQPRDWQPPKR
jgi:RHS repeat-associated protein